MLNAWKNPLRGEMELWVKQPGGVISFLLQMVVSEQLFLGVCQSFHVMCSWVLKGLLFLLSKTEQFRIDDTAFCCVFFKKIKLH